MTPEQWARIEEIFARALDLTEPERTKLLDTACGDDVALRTEVESLLTSHDTAPEFLSTQPAWLATPEDTLPDRIGPYRVIRTLGRGGMGQVYLVEREAHEFRQIVALKVLRRGLDTDDLLARFRTERQILARLNHPNIARLFDAGATEQGLPYFVMEYVDGVPILEYCNTKQLGVRERLKQFQMVCSAVEYAHRSLIVHRDIKPGNILVGDDGVPKLLDFGIAKILDADLSTAAQTRAEMRLLTPEYSAPEQIRGEAITTACDVHALGVLLYELLAGVHPFRSDAGREAVINAVLSDDPPPPSTVRPTGSVLRRQLAGDLDTIVLKALRKEPEARYSSVQSLAYDLDRHLDGLPVLARPATVTYRARKFIARNLVAVSAAALLFVMLTGFSGVTLYQSRRIRDESVRVTRERDKAMQARTFLLEMFGTSGPDQATGDSVTARQLLDRRAATVADAYSKDPEVRAEMENVLAEGYEKLGLLDQAEPLARSALATRRQLFAGDHADVAVSLNVLGWLLHEKSKLDEAEPLLREAVAMGRRVYPAAGDPALARALNDLGVVREARADYEEATSLYTESLDMRRRLLGEDHVGVAVTTSNLSVVLYRQNDLAGAVKMSEDALARFGRVLGPDHQRTTIVQSNLAAMQSQLGDHAAAARQHRDLVAKRTRLFGAQHASVAYSMTMLANELVLMDSIAAGDSLSQQALVLQRDAHASPAQIATTLRVQGDVAERKGEHALAMSRYDEALRITREVSGPSHRDVPVLLMRMGAVHAAQGDMKRAESSYREAVSAATGRKQLEVRLKLAELLAAQGRKEDAGAEIARVESGFAEAKVAPDDTLRAAATRIRSSIR